MLWKTINMIAILRTQTEQTIFGNLPLRIGSAPGNQLVLNDASVEPFHAELLPSGGGYNIMDLSKNSGTFVNKQRLNPSTPQSLQNGDRIYIGNVELIYEVTSSFSVLPTVPSLGSSDNAGYSPEIPTH
jgi:predicted component of type VI protein secretion system